MAIMGPNDLPILKIPSDPLKSYALRKLGYPHTAVEITEDQLETALRVTGDFIAGYFPREQKLAVFYTQPLQPTYPMPDDAYWIQEVQWDSAYNLNDVFSAEAFLFNIGQVTGLQSVLTDIHLLQAYKKFSRKILGTDGSWEVINEGGEGPTNQKIRLYPTPKGVFPVLVLYYPVVTHFRSPTARLLACDMMLAETKTMVGMTRRKMAGIPLPDGSSLTLDGDALVQEGNEEREQLIQKAIDLGEPLGIYLI